MKDRRARAVLWLWFAAMVVLCGVLLGRHLLALPRPTGSDTALAASLATLRRPEDAGRTLVLHVLYAECRCSRRIVEHLEKSQRPSDVVETVLFVGEDPATEARLAARGIRVRRTSAEELASEWHIQAVPLLVVTSPDGEVRYAGGYTTRKQGAELHDLEIIRRASVSGIAALPVFGCAVADELRRKLDPTGIL